MDWLTVIVTAVITAAFMCLSWLVGNLIYDGIKEKKPVNDKSIPIPVNNNSVDLSGIESKIEGCTTAIIDLTKVSSTTKGTVEQIDKRIDNLQKEFAQTQKGCSNKFNTLFEENKDIRSKLNVIPAIEPTVKKK
jgi:archaellum component FlaC